jgi:hypothetical protein
MRTARPKWRAQALASPRVNSLRASLSRAPSIRVSPFGRST